MMLGLSSVISDVVLIPSSAYMQDHCCKMRLHRGLCSMTFYLSPVIFGVVLIPGSEYMQDHCCKMRLLLETSSLGWNQG